MSTFTGLCNLQMLTTLICLKSSCYMLATCHKIHLKIVLKSLTLSLINTCLRFLSQRKTLTICETLLTREVEVHTFTKGGGVLEFVHSARSKPRSSYADNGWLHNDTAQDQLPCSVVGIALHYVYARRNQWLYR